MGAEGAAGLPWSSPRTGCWLLVSEFWGCGKAFLLLSVPAGLPLAVTMCPLASGTGAIWEHKEPVRLEQGREHSAGAGTGPEPVLCS